MDWEKKTKRELIEEIERLRSQEQQNKWGQLVEHSCNLIVTCDLQGYIKSANNPWVEQLGYTREELFKLKFVDLIHLDYRDGDMDMLKKVHPGLVQGIPMTTALVTKSNKKVYLKGCLIPEVNENTLYGFSAIFYDISETVRIEKSLELYCNITELTFQSPDNKSLFEGIHAELSKVIDSKNFYIALYDKEKDGKYLNFPYYVDEYFKAEGQRHYRKFAKGLTEFTMLGGKPKIIRKEEISRLSRKGEIVTEGLLPYVWLGVPLKLENEIVGLVAVQGYDQKTSYTQSDLELLDFISGQIALAIEKNEQERRLNNQTARLNAIFESSSHLIWSVNKNLELTSFNQNYFEAIFQNYDEKPNITYEEDGHLTSVPYDDFWAQKYQMAFRGEALNFEIELNQGRGKVWKEIFLNPIYQAHGKIEEISGIAHDISSKKHSELALQESEEKFRNIFESFQDLYFRCSFSGIVQMVSPSVKEVMGFDPQEVIGEKVTRYYRYTPRTKFIIAKLLAQKGIKNFEVSLMTKSSEILNCICNIRMVYTKSGIPIAIEGVARDISSLKKANEELIRAKEVAEKSLKVKEKFLANMSHEIRTPMNGIIGMIDLMAQTQLNLTQTKYVNTIKMSSETLLDILNDILDLSKIEAGKMELKKTLVKVPKMMEKLAALFSQQASEKNISLTYEVCPEVPLTLITDETRLLQILSNLTSNAIKFTERGGVVQIKMSQVSDEGEYKTLKLQVIDTGIGISEEDRKKLFTNFTQLDGSTTKVYKGTGLGLVISKNLALLLGGEIGVDSEPGKGSDFWFTFRAKQGPLPEELPSEPEESPLISEPLQFHDITPRILVVDDNAVNRKVASGILKNAGCQVTMANGGLEAIAKVQSDRYDAVFMDIQMPVMDGITATRKIKERLKKDTPPIIAMTAYSMEEDEKKFLSKGMDDYVSKPIKAHVLIGKVAQWMNLSEKIDTPPRRAEKIDGQVVNQETIAQLRKYGSDDMLSEAYDSFNEESVEQLRDCWNSMKNNDYKEILSKLHTLKGNAGTLGIEKVSLLAETIEEKVKKGDHLSLKEDLLTLNEVFLEYKRNISKILNT